MTDLSDPIPIQATQPVARPLKEKNLNKVLQGRELNTAWRAERELLGVAKNERVLQLLDVAVSLHGTEADLYIDISQSVDWKPWTIGSIRSVTTGTQIFALQRDRLVTEMELMRCLGFPPWSIPEGLSRHTLRDLCGQCMALPAVGLAMLSVMTCMDIPGLFSSERKQAVKAHRRDSNHCKAAQHQLWRIIVEAAR